ncbi:MAG: iron-containing alcohol dehydrogenase, partial [Candidatus Bathyarchaeia archaeon]
ELHTLERLERSVPPVDVVAGIGGGSSHDLAKYLALKKGARLVQVPTILSADACVTSSIGIRENWMVKYIGHVLTDRILVDFSLIKQAPKELVRCGASDILSSHTSTYDWKLASIRGKEEFDQSYYNKAIEILS